MTTPALNVTLTGDVSAQAVAAGWTPPPTWPPKPVANVPYKTYVGGDEFLDPSGTGEPDPTLWEKVVWYSTAGATSSISDNGGGTADPAQVSVNGNVGLILKATSSTPLQPSTWHNGWVDSAPAGVTPGIHVKAPFCAEAFCQLPAPAPGLWPAWCWYQDTKDGASEYAEFDGFEGVLTPGSAGEALWQSWHPAGSAPGASRQFGAYGINLTGLNTYTITVDASGNIQYYFNGTPNGAAIVGGPNALEPMWCNFVMSTGGNPKDGWAGAPTVATPSTVQMVVRHLRIWTP